MKYDQQEMKQAFDNLRELRLSSRDRFTMKASIISYMKNNPVHDEFPVESDSPVVISHTHTGWTVFVMNPLIRILIIVVTLTGGTLLASEKALPGDPLYAFKTNVTEPLRGVVVFSNTAKAEWEYELAERRLKEVIALSESLSLTQEQHIRLVADFKKHAENSRDLDQSIQESVSVAQTKRVASVKQANGLEQSQSVGITNVSDLQSRFRDWLSLQKEVLLSSDKQKTPEQQIIISAIEDELAVMNSTTTIIDSASLGDEQVLFSFTSSQRSALEKMGVDIEPLDTLTEIEQVCMEDKLSETRFASLIGGEMPTLLDVVAIESCFIDEPLSPENEKETSETGIEESQE